MISSNDDLAAVNMITSSLIEGITTIPLRVLYETDLSNEEVRHAFISRYVRNDLNSWNPAIIEEIREALPRVLQDYPESPTDPDEQTVLRDLFWGNQALTNYPFGFEREFFQEVWDLILSDKSFPNPWQPRRMPEL